MHRFERRLRAIIEAPDGVKRIGQNRLEWALLGLIALACAGLSLLRHQWTGEVSRAERTRLRSALNDQAGRLVRAFDDELRQNCRALLPEAAEIREEGVREAHTSRYRQWASSHVSSHKLFRALNGRELPTGRVS